MRLGSVPFLKAVDDVTGGNSKIQRKDFQQAGILPVIDQGQEKVAGYTDDMEAAFQGSLPVVLFGDHTRIFKYADKPFALGADGVKVLAPRDGFDAKFIYYYLLSCDIPSRGYSRHFKFLKEQVIPVFAPSEQRRIVEILDEADQLRRLRREADAKAARILPALFLKMFGDPATNPMGWDLTTIGNVTSAIDYGTSTKSSDDGSGMPLIRMGNVDYNGHLDLRNLKHIQLSESEVARFRLWDGDILFNRTNSKELVGKTGLWDVDIEALAASYFIRIRVDCEQVTPTFFWAFMNCSYMKKVLRLTARGAIGQANINSSELRALVMYKPPLDQQHLFTNRWKQIRATIPQRVSDQTDLDSLFATLLQRAFSGQLTAKWREAHSKELLAEMEQQARLLNLPLPKELEAAP